MSHTFDEVWSEVGEALSGAKGIAFDGCHKIYILLDHQQYDLMITYGYGDGDGSLLISSMGMDEEEMLKTIKAWYKDSCSLRFVESVESVKEGEDPNYGFTNIIPQGYEAEFCVDCGNFGADIEGYCDDCRTEWCDNCGHNEAWSEGLCHYCADEKEREESGEDEDEDEE